MSQIKQAAHKGVSDVIEEEVTSVSDAVVKSQAPIRHDNKDRADDE